jgi:hypothetical protein
MNKSKSHDNQIALSPVEPPMLTLIVNLLPSKLVADTDTCSPLDETSNPLIKTLITGESLPANGALIFV